MNSSTIPFNEIATLFVDVGNTLLSIDFPWVCEELARLGPRCEPEILQRTEAAARPAISETVKNIQVKETSDVFKLYLGNLLSHLPKTVLARQESVPDLVEALLPRLLPQGKTQRLWSYILPGVPQALETLKNLNLQLVVVSNSDGTVECSLQKNGLSRFFDHVVDSHVVGFEKPNPAIFKYALQVSGANRNKTLHVGDMFDIDIAGARSAGIHAILIDPYDDWPNCDCERIPDILKLSEKLKEG